MPSDANLDGNTNDRAQLTGENPRIDNPTPALWFNPAAFVQNRAVVGAPVDGNHRAIFSMVPDSASSIWHSRATSGWPEGPG